MTEEQELKLDRMDRRTEVIQEGRRDSNKAGRTEDLQQGREDRKTRGAGRKAGVREKKSNRAGRRGISALTEECKEETRTYR